jgi:hypothetical protein
MLGRDVLLTAFILVLVFQGNLKAGCPELKLVLMLCTHIGRLRSFNIPVVLFSLDCLNRLLCTASSLNLDAFRTNRLPS